MNNLVFIYIKTNQNRVLNKTTTQDWTHIDFRDLSSDGCHHVRSKFIKNMGSLYIPKILWMRINFLYII